MDAYVQSGHRDDLARADTAKAILRNMSKVSMASENACVSAVQKASAVLASSSSDDPRRPGWLSRILDLTVSLNSSVGADVVQTQDKHLNLDSLHVPERLHSNYLLYVLGNIVNISRGSDDCSAAVASLLSRTDPGDGGFYDDMGSVRDSDRPHLVGSNSQGGTDDMGDPSGYYTAVQGGYEITSTEVPPQWLRYSMSFYDAPLRLQYTELDRGAMYTLKIVYWHPNRDSTDDVYRLVAGSSSSSSSKSNNKKREPVLIHDYISAPNPMRVLEFPLPPEVYTESGTLDLECSRRPGGGGNGKTCEISEVWVVRAQE